MLAPLWISGLLRHRSARLLFLAACVTLAVALVASLGVFITVSNERMTRQAAAGVPVDWQVQLAPGTSARTVADLLFRRLGARRAVETGFGEVRSMTATTGPTVQTTGAGVVVGVPDSYATWFPGEIRYLTGSRSGVLIAQQTAANLHVAPSDSVAVALPGGGVRNVRVAGVIDLPAADSLFQVVGAPPGAGASAPPDNVMVVPLSQWDTIFGPLAAAHPGAVRRQLHVQLSRDLPSDPGAAYAGVVARAHHLEALMAGGVLRSTWLVHRRGGVLWRGTFYPIAEVLASQRFRIG